MAIWFIVGLVLLVVGLVVALAVVIDPVRWGRKMPRWVQWAFNRVLSKAQGEARWMNRRERGEFINSEHKGFVLGPGQRMSLDQSNRNFVVVGPTGGGKTTNFVLPNMFERRGSFVIFDLGGHIYRRSSGEMQRRGYNVEVLAPANPKFSKQYNPLKRRPRGRDLRKLAKALCERVSDAKNPFWSIAAVTPLYCVLMALKNMEAEGQKVLKKLAGDKRLQFDAEKIQRFIDWSRGAHLGNARHLVNGLSAGSEIVNRLMAETLDKVTWSEFEGFMGLDQRTKDTHLGTVLAALEAWSDPDIAGVTAGDNIDLDNLRKRETVLYVVAPEQEVEDYGVLMNLFLADVFRQCYRDGGKGLPVQILADEFGNIGKVEGFKAAITTLRKFGVSTTIFLQSSSQLKAIYGDDSAETIFEGGIANKIFLPGLWLKQSPEISEVLGSETIYDTTYGGIDERSRTIEKPLLRLDEVRQVAENEAIIIASNKRPLKLQLTPYYKDARMSRLAKQPPAQLDFAKGRSKLDYLDLGPHRQLSDGEYLVDETAARLGRGRQLAVA